MATRLGNLALLLKDTNRVSEAEPLMARAVLSNRRGRMMDTLILGVTFAGSLGTAWMIQRAILAVCLKAIAPSRR